MYGSYGVVLLNKEIYIVDGARIPIGKFGKSLAHLSAVDLGVQAVRALFKRTEINPSHIDLIIMGQVLRAGTGQLTARQVAVKVGLPLYTPAMNVDMVCASSMLAIVIGVLHIAMGVYDLIIAGGMESMSNAPFIIPAKARWGLRHFVLKQGCGTFYDSMVIDGLWDPILNLGMGLEADKVARHYGATKEELDWIGYESHRKAAQAWSNGVIKKYVEPVVVNGKILLDKDEGIRKELTLEEARNSPPVFSNDGLHTVISSSQLSDGAAAILLASKEAVKKLGLEPKARIVDFVYTARETWEFIVASIDAAKKVLEKAGWSIDKVDFWEINEAFAVNVFLTHKLLGIPYEQINVHGGAIAIGHPIGASGARIVIELINVLETYKGTRGIASICHGTGGAIALAIELL